MAFQLSDFQRKKIQHVFDVFYDVNKDKVIQWEDFQMAIDKISKMHNWTKGSLKHTMAVETLELIWNQMKLDVDEDGDAQVTTEEWFHMWTKFVNPANANTNLPEWLQKYQTFMFEVNDASADDVIDKGEFTLVYTYFGIPKANCEEAFDKISNGGKTKIDRAEYARLWKEHFVTNDPKSNANYLFGLNKF